MEHQTMSHLSFTKKMNFTKYGAIEKNNIVLGNYALNIFLSKKLFMVPIL